MDHQSFVYFVGRERGQREKKREMKRKSNEKRLKLELFIIF